MAKPLKYETQIKNLLDKLPNGNDWYLNGQQLTDGYFPDRVYRRNNRDYLVEIEASTSRKGFIGGYVKAQAYFDSEGRKGALIYIIKGDRANTKLASIHAQLTRYHRWLKSHGLPLQATYILYDATLRRLVRSKATMLSKDFLTADARAIR